MLVAKIANEWAETTGEEDALRDIIFKVRFPITAV